MIDFGSCLRGKGEKVEKGAAIPKMRPWGVASEGMARCTSGGRAGRHPTGRWHAPRGLRAARAAFPQSPASPQPCGPPLTRLMNGMKSLTWPACSGVRASGASAMMCGAEKSASTTN